MTTKKAAGVISRGAQGVETLVKITVHFRGLRPPRNSCVDFNFRCVLTLLSKYFLSL